MHKNTFIDAPKSLDKYFKLKNKPYTYFAGQITGVEGYVESSASGLMTAIYLYNKIKGKKVEPITDKTVLGSLAKYITTENKDFQPMNANFGILPPLDRIVRDKKERKRLMAERSLKETEQFKKELEI